MDDGVHGQASHHTLPLAMAARRHLDRALTVGMLVEVLGLLKIARGGASTRSARKSQPADE